MIKQPPYLKKGDKVAIVCPARKLRTDIAPALRLLEEWGLVIIEGKSVYAQHHQYAGDDQLRTADLQTFLDDTEIKAIVAARGGYGTVRIIDGLDFSGFNLSPKWMVGFSDITVLLSHITGALQTQSIHGQMPGSFEKATPESLESLRKALFGETLSYTCDHVNLNRTGAAEGVLIGGNLSILISLEGSVSQMDYNNKILFLEDVGELEYALDRMLRMLKRSGKLAGLKGLIVGAFTEIKAEYIPYGESVEQLILEIIKEYNYPVCFGFPVGHIPNNHALILGKTVSLTVGEQQTSLSYI